MTERSLQVEVAIDAHTSIRAKCNEWGVTKILAFSGGSEAPSGVEPRRYEQDVKQMIETIVSGFQGRPIAILCGGTGGGIPEYAARAAKSAQLKVIGVYPQRGREYVLGTDVLDYVVEVGPMGDGSYWGDESSLFASIPDAVVLIGGRTGTLIEVAHLLRINETRVKKGAPVKLIPVGGTFGVADLLRTFPMDDRVRVHAIPQRIITSPDEVIFEVFQHFNMA
jgi:predicted Rossmann-fold nucleotide-binding protein